MEGVCPLGSMNEQSKLHGNLSYKICIFIVQVDILIRWWFFRKQVVEVLWSSCLLFFEITLSWTKILAKGKFWLDGGSEPKVRGSTTLLRIILHSEERDFSFQTSWTDQLKHHLRAMHFSKCCLFWTSLTWYIKIVSLGSFKRKLHFLFPSVLCEALRRLWDE